MFSSTSKRESTLPGTKGNIRLVSSYYNGTLVVFLEINNFHIILFSIYVFSRVCMTRCVSLVSAQ